MIKTKLAIFALLAMAITAHAMNNDVTVNNSIRRACNPFYMDLHYAITHGHTAGFMEALNKMEAAGHALDGEDYDDLMKYGRQKGFGHIDIMERDTYQKFTAAVLKDDVLSFIDHLSNGADLSSGELYWLLDLSKQVNSNNVSSILNDEYHRRKCPSPTDF